MIVVWLFLVMPWVCLQIVILVLAYLETWRVFRLGQNMLPARYLHMYVCYVVPNICQKHVHGLPDLPYSDDPFKFLDNLFL